MQGRNRKPKARVIDFRCDSDFFYQKGMACFQTGDLEHAKKYMERALKMDPNCVDYLCRQAEILAEMEQYEASTRLLQKIIYDLDAQMTDCYFFIANNYAYMGEFQEALDAVRTYLMLDPNGVFKHEAQELYQMLDSEAKDQEHEESNYVSVHERGRMELEHGHFEEAARCFAQVIEDEPDFLAAQNNLSIAYFSLNAADKAFGAAHRVLDRDPGNIHALCNIMTFCAQLGDRNGMRQAAARLDLLYPLYPEHCGKIGSTYLFIGNYEKAYYWLRMAEKRGARRDQVFSFWMALAAYHCGYEEVARRNWRRVDYFSEKPFHPFKYGKIQDMMFEAGAQDNFMVGDLIRRVVGGEDRAYKIFALFYAAKSGDRALLQKIAANHGERGMMLLARRFLAEMESGRHDACLQVMRAVEQLAGGGKEAMKHAELYSFWAVVDSIATVRDEDVNGWSAALIYLWKKEYGEPVAQKRVAERAGTTLYRLRKHIGELSAALERQWEGDPL